ncbi:MAG: ATP-binding protein [Thermoleophilia bacterium]
MTRRLVAGYLALAAAVLLALELPLAIIYRRNEAQSVQARIEREAVALASFSEDTMEADLPRVQRQRVNANTRLVRLVTRYSAEANARAVLVAKDGTVLIDTDTKLPIGRNFTSRPEIARALKGEPNSGERRSATLGTTLVYAAVPVASGGVVHGAVRVSFAARVLDERVRRYWITLGVIAAVVLAAVAFIGRLLAQWVASPLAELGSAAERAGEGDLAARADEHRGPPEVRRLARRLNASTASLEALIGSHRAFVADASHQLRTPLTALRLRLENMETEVLPEGHADLEAAVAETDRLERLVNGLLTLVRTEHVSQTAVPVDLPAIVRDRAAAWEALAEEEHIRLTVDAPESLTARAVPGAVEQVVDNLVDNAVQASPEGGEVAVEVGRDGAWAVLRVADRGPGMSEADMASAFERFWTKRDRTGTGLGLAIVQELARASGGSARLVAREGGGLAAEVRLPVIPPR